MSSALKTGADALVEQMHAVASVALQSWSLDAVSVDLVKMRENTVFRVTRRDGGKAALRIHRLGYHTDASLASEFVWMQALKNAAIDVPTPIASRRGRIFELVDVAGLPDPRQVSVFEWLDGRQLGSMESGVGDDVAMIAACYRTVGELAARMHNAATSWTPPAGFVRHAWDTHGLVGESPLWGRFWELPILTEAERELLHRTRSALAVDLTLLDRSPSQYGLIHADLGPENIMVECPGTRVIDFDDAGYGWHLFDLATSIYFLIGSSAYATALHALIEGYRSQRPLPETTLEQLPLFLAARGTTYLGWVLTRPQTETAERSGRDLVSRACGAAEQYLSARAAGPFAPVKRSIKPP